MRPRRCLSLVHSGMGARGSLVSIWGGMHARGSAIRPRNRVRTHRSHVVIGGLRARHLRFLIAFGRNARGTRDISSISGTLQALRLRARRLPSDHSTRNFPMSRLAMGVPADDFLAPA